MGKMIEDKISIFSESDPKITLKTLSKANFQIIICQDYVLTANRIRVKDFTHPKKALQITAELKSTYI